MEFEAIHVGILSVIPPLIAISLALITKQVIFSLILGILSGTFIYGLASGMGVVAMFNVASDLMITKVGGNAAMVIFLAILGALVAVITRAGGSMAYGQWASQKLKSAKSASLATVFLGLIIFIDDYFNCLTVGTVMRPITDKHKISREKLAYLIDATAAPICIIAPVSSWAASVISYYPTQSGITGMQAFVSSVPMNLYALLSIFMIIWISLKPKSDFGPMAKAQARAQEGQIQPSGSEEMTDELSKLTVSSKGKVLDLIIPVLILVVMSILAMLFYGGFHELEGGSLGTRIFEAFGETDAGMALALGGFVSVIAAFFIFVPRKLMNLAEFFSAVTAGIKSMVPALIILALAWTISGVCRDLLSTGPYVASLVEGTLPAAFIPVIMFIVAAALSFSTGTSWGTFGILIPITIDVCDAVAPWLSITALSAVLAGSVFGDHCSPISDTTILSSTGAQCKHIDHVATQIPYALTVAGACFIGYIIAGITSTMGYAVSVAITLPVSLALLIAALLIIPKFVNKGVKA